VSLPTNPLLSNLKGVLRHGPRPLRFSRPWGGAPSPRSPRDWGGSAAFYRELDFGRFAHTAVAASTAEGEGTGQGARGRSRREWGVPANRRGGPSTTNVSAVSWRQPRGPGGNVPPEVGDPDSPSHAHGPPWPSSLAFSTS